MIERVESLTESRDVLAWRERQREAHARRAVRPSVSTVVEPGMAPATSSAACQREAVNSNHRVVSRSPRNRYRAGSPAPGAVIVVVQPLGARASRACADAR